ncbi:hypothetical protein F4818DRAFT_430194 [Hypoxylon cercidicola]|nr:hypothetical protein F4818DRAFT_430194 [Hypoxylon cercidicola]
MVSSETYRAIQNWIGQQLEYEATHSAPAPLTDAQRKLLDKLEQALPPATPLLAEPDMGDANTNWVGLLMEDRAARQRGSTVGEPDFKEKAGPVVLGVQKWYYEVRIDEHPAPFPNSESGFLPDGTQPYFTRKKDAKRYAAKCAMEWLRNRRMPQGSSNGMASAQVQNRPVTPQFSPERKKQKLSASSPEQSKNPASKPDVIQEVRQLCERLGGPEPRYILAENADQPGFFSGYPDMGILVSALPAGTGRVEDVLGKKSAREKIAEELVVPLRAIAAKHEEANQRYIKTLPPLKQGSEGNRQPSS